MKKLLWLDDLRNPFLDLENKVPDLGLSIVWVLNFKEFKLWIKNNGLPEAISFDHDLALEHYTPEYFWDNYEESKKFQDWKSKKYKHKTGEHCAIWLKKYCKKHKLKLPKIFVHSANPVGVDKIKKALK